MKKMPTVGCLFLLLTVFCGPVVGGTNIRIQTVMGSDSPEHFMLNQFASDVAILTGQEVTFEVLEKDAVVGTQGLIPTSWHRTHEQWGATQMQNRFRRNAGRWMTPVDYGAWVGMRSIGEAVTRVSNNNLKDIREFLVSEKFAKERSL